MKEVYIYIKPTCTTCRKLAKSLRERGIEFKDINYFVKPLSKAKIKSLAKKIGISPVELIRKKDKLYKELGLKDKKINQAEALDLLIKEPNLMSRPIVELGEKAVIANPIEQIEELFS
ncbi:MAG: arsenate reductase [Melioribacteraceae bacterium]|nr:arsenate reductase [Melioribacteraceae bacterium]MCF8264517.1 arsenate reductase [Melioribacteraceae bacterium]MCF8412483.1 arsenate reductase [Melioribacteraceae bacterium]